uniref:Transmembrane protein n=1 Tax=Pithovirus LCPAC102 TaxID=2506587 RepID=A0A4D5XF70_9VIRU|nr:MAG: uncharacterized protein LCPAC102_01480 [Pithovirus LCPAC102]
MANNEDGWGWTIFYIIIIIIWLIILIANTYYWYLLAYPPDDAIESSQVSSGTAVTLFWINVIILVIAIICIIIALIYWFAYSDTDEVTIVTPIPMEKVEKTSVVTPITQSLNNSDNLQPIYVSSPRVQSQYVQEPQYASHPVRYMEPDRFVSSNPVHYEPSQIRPVVLTSVYSPRSDVRDVRTPILSTL